MIKILEYTLFHTSFFILVTMLTQIHNKTTRLSSSRPNDCAQNVLSLLSNTNPLTWVTFSDVAAEPLTPHLLGAAALVVRQLK